ncbi:hypothetical protein [Rubripirellula obstinata]|uniref:hypothetical protein n=1 Tax=Rubripirellula obstinata TaxID=406547 RepID=UPI00122D3FB3|nr:hypothetical protein [Rubripirellula obstinata]
MNHQTASGGRSAGRAKRAGRPATIVTGPEGIGIGREATDRSERVCTTIDSPTPKRFASRMMGALPIPTADQWETV